MRAARRSAIIAVAIAACGGSEKTPSRPAPASVSITDLEADGSRSLDALTAVARDPEHPQRLAAIRALGRLGDDRAVTALIAIAADSDPAIRERAAVSLGIAAQMGATSVADGLLERWSAETEPAVKRALAIALGRSGDARAVAPLVARLADPSAEVIDAAALGLGLLGRKKVPISDAARRALAEQVASAARRYAATYALANEHQPPVDPVVLRVLEALAGDRDPEIRTLALTGLSRRSRGRARFTAALDDPDWRVAVAAVNGLAAFESDAATGDVAGWLTRADPLATSPMAIRAALRLLIDRADTPSALSAAIAVANKVRGAPDSLDRSQIECLARAVGARASGDLSALRACGPTAPAWWREALIAEVVASRKAPAAERLRELAALRASGDARVRAAAITGLARLGSSVEVRGQVIGAITAALADTSAAVAGTAAEAIAGLSLEDSESGPVHAALVKRGSAELGGDAELGLTIVGAIAANRVASGEPVCRSAHGHRNRAVRRAGRECLTALTGADPGPGSPAAAATLPHRPGAGAPLRWTVETSRGTLAIALDPARAPWHVAAIAGLTRAGFYDGLIFHRVVPGFVTQGGDPSGTGWGGPDFVLPPEPSEGAYRRGVVGVADAGPGTGGSQWFVMHARAPHLEGRYTIIGEVVSGLEVIDKLAVGDRIVKATIAADRP